MEPRGLSPLPRAQTTEKEVGRQVTLISYSIKSSFKAKVTDFSGTLKPTAFHSFGKMLQVPAVIICQFQGIFVSKTFLVFQTHTKIIQSILFTGMRWGKC